MNRNSSEPYLLLIKRFLLTAAILIAPFLLFAQDMIVVEFYHNPSDQTANTPTTEVFDQNGERCALIKVETTQTGFAFDVGTLGITKVVQGVGEIWVYVPHGVRHITIQHPTLGVVRHYEFPVLIDEANTYILKLETGQMESLKQEIEQVRNVSVVKDTSEHTFVDLGLSVLWAATNIGASKPTEYGNFYAWGEILPKINYYLDIYKYNKGGRKNFTKYCTRKKYGTVDNRQLLDETDDVASKIWGESCRIPTQAECEELIANCDWKWTMIDGVVGFLVISRINRNSIFLPANGIKSGATWNYVGMVGAYWSANLDAKSNEKAHVLALSQTEPGVSTSYLRFLGCAIRAVRPKSSTQNK